MYLGAFTYIIFIFWTFLYIMSDFDTKKSVFLVFNENFRIEI